MEALRALGVISGTSMDGIDIALIKTDGVSVEQHIASAVMPYPQALKAELIEFLKAPKRAESEPLEALDNMASEAFGDAIAAFMKAQNFARTDIDIIGLHGQTIWHNPAIGFTRQLGDGAKIAVRSGITCVDQFRHADMKAGGQGAPLAPLYHQALARDLGQPICFLNFGGVGNLSYIHGEGLIAFDTGPASALIDDYMRRHYGREYDVGGQLAARGRADREIITEFLRLPYFAEKPPKSLDRQEFHPFLERVELFENREDAVASMAMMTVKSVEAAIQHLPKPPREWLVCGGGRHNGFFINKLRENLNAPFIPVEHIGLDGDALEAECFGFLAVRALRGLPLSLPSTTGVKKPISGGRIHQP